MTETLERHSRQVGSPHHSLCPPSPSSPRLLFVFSSLLSFFSSFFFFFLFFHLSFSFFFLFLHFIFILLFCSFFCHLFSSCSTHLFLKSSCFVFIIDSFSHLSTQHSFQSFFFSFFFECNLKLINIHTFVNSQPSLLASTLRHLGFKTRFFSNYCNLNLFFKDTLTTYRVLLTTTLPFFSNEYFEAFNTSRLFHTLKHCCFAFVFV